MATNQTEPSVNVALGNLLQGMMGSCVVRSENTTLVVGQSGAQIDNLITAAGRSPIAVEAEFMPAREAEKDAASRLGKEIKGESRIVEAAIALCYPAALRRAANLEDALRDAPLSWCVLYEERDEDGRHIRFPKSGWLEGGVEDLADLIRLVSTPQREVDRAADSLQAGIERAAGILDELREKQQGILRSVADLLGMANVEQTRRMACAIIANALVFHERIAGMHDGVQPLRLVCGPDIANPQRETLASWNSILEINYFPIFAIAYDIVEQLPARTAARILNELRDTAQEVDSAGVDNAHDLTGRIFQRLIADRKYLATFYTRPSAAALLARLAISLMDDVDWSDADAIGGLRIGDFACGTGALLSAVYDQIALRHERAGGDPAALHSRIIEDVLYGCDVMPSAVHITSATLSGAYPDVSYRGSKLYTVPYSRQADGTVRIGSLELIQSSALMASFNTSDPALRTASAREETAEQVNIEIPDDSFDLVIMNPPFVSTTKHYDAEDGVVAAAFAAYDSTEDDQVEMAARLKQLAKKSTYHGHAGLGSAFATVAHRKLKPGGVLALVLPATLVNGSSWEKVRTRLAATYTDMRIITIAANGDEMAFSHDTEITDCLVVARKSADPTPAEQRRAHFTSLISRPRGPAEAAAIAQSILRRESVRTLEGGPYGGTPVPVGDDQAGETLDAPTIDPAAGWGAARLADATVAQVASATSEGQMWPPAASEPLNVAMVRLNEIGMLGVHDSYLTLKTHNGPFKKRPPSRTATFPALCNHKAENETQLIVRPDASMQVIPGKEARADELWKTAGRTHLNRDFTFGAQALAVAFTERESLGGRVWPNITFTDERFDFAFAVWGNSTLGLLLYWWFSSRQQSSKASMTRLVIPQMPVLDFRTLSDQQLRAAEDAFSELSGLELQPAYLADADPHRALLDRRVICDLLGFDEEVYRGVRLLAQKWCAEPSVHGGKERPPGAKPVV